jgi:hypothetical protein
LLALDERECFIDATFVMAKGGGAEIAATKRGKGMKIIGIVFSMFVMLFEVAHPLIYFLRAPQAGVPVIQTTGGGRATWVSAADVLNLLALIFIMFGASSLAFGSCSVLRSHPRSFHTPTTKIDIRVG